MKSQDSVCLFNQGIDRQPVSIIIPLHNYENYVVEAMNSVANQTFCELNLIVVDDCSTDRSVDVVMEWMQSNTASGIGLALLRNTQNAKLAVTRNIGINFTDTKYCFFLDADNALYPRCIEKHVAALEMRSDAAAAYSLIEVFGARSGIMGAGVFDRNALKHGNYIDAMSLIRRDVLIELDGFRHMHGWEDYDLWLRLCETNRFAVHIPEILSRYREHSASMLRTATNTSARIAYLHAEMKRLHNWLDLH